MTKLNLSSENLQLSYESVNIVQTSVRALEFGHSSVNSLTRSELN